MRDERGQAEKKNEQESNGLAPHLLGRRSLFSTILAALHSRTYRPLDQILNWTDRLNVRLAVRPLETVRNESGPHFDPIRV